MDPRQVTKTVTDRSTFNGSVPRQAVHRHWLEVDDELEDLEQVELHPTYARVSGEDDDDDLHAAAALLSRAAAANTQKHSCVKVYFQYLLASKSFQAFVAILIIVNAVVIGLETDGPAEESDWWEFIENLLLLCFSVELAMRFVAWGWAAFFNINGSDFVWNLFDLSLVSLGVFDFFCGEMLGFNHGSGIATIFRIFRLLRILRIFRLIRFLKQLYILTYGFALASLAIFWVTILMTAALYICAVVLVRTYGRLPKEDPDHDFFQEHYGDIFTALFTLFQLMMQPNLLAYQTMLGRRPILAVFLVIFVIFGSFGMIALLTGVITEAMFEKNVLRLQEEQLERESARKNITNKCSKFFSEIKTNQFGEASRKEIVLLLPRVAEMLESMNIQFARDDLLHMLSVMDTDGSGAINKTEFCRGLLHLAERGDEMQPILLMELQQDAITFVKNKVEKLEGSVTRLESMHSDMLTELRGLNAHAQEEKARPACRPPGATSPSSPRSDSRGAMPSKDSCAGGSLQAVAQGMSKIEQFVSMLQGDVFSMSTRLEEIVSDSRSEEISSQLGELAVRRRCMEFESTANSRLNASEAAARQAQRASEEAASQIAALATQVQSLTRALEDRGLTASGATAPAPM